jgi:hypothetical protein
VIGCLTNPTAHRQADWEASIWLSQSQGDISGERAVSRSMPLGLRRAVSLWICLLCVPPTSLAWSARALAASPLRWSSPSRGPSGSLDAVACPSASLCVVLDEFHGNVFTSTDPRAGASSRWSHKRIDRRGLLAVACASTSLCVAADTGGYLLTSTDPRAGAGARWTSKYVDRSKSSKLSLGVSISCPSVSLCVAADNRGNVFTSTDPRAGVGARWSRRTRVGGAISCPSTSVCLAFGSRAFVSTDPADGANATWTAEGGLAGNFGANDVSCPSVSFCAMAGEDTDQLGNTIGVVDTSTDPGAGGSATWTSHTLSSSGLIETAVSCGSISLCVALDNYATPHVFTSVDPAAGPSAVWTKNRGVSGYGVSCATSTLCVVAGFDGVFIGRGR